MRAITNSHRMRDSSVMMSSAMPSEKYSCSGSPLMLVKARTAIDGLSGNVGAIAGDPVTGRPVRSNRHLAKPICLLLA